MRKILFLLINLIFLNTYSQGGKDIRLIDNFTKKYFLNKTNEIDILEFTNFTDLNKKFYNSLSEKRKLDLNEYLVFLLNTAHQELKINDYKYKILLQSELKLDKNKTYQIDYKNKKSIYYLISKDKIFAFFIVENHKIISFLPKGFMSIDTKNIEPFFLNSENDIKELLGIENEPK